jgi:hypothetical protein
MEEVAVFRFTSPEDSYSSRMGTPQNVGVIGVAFFPERVRPPTPVVRRPRPLPRPAPLPYDYSGDASGSRDMDSERTAQRPQMKPSAPAKSPAPASEGRGDFEPRLRAESKGSTKDDFGSSNRVNNLGTEFGENHESLVSSVSFERASATHPALLRTLRYDDADGLSARGIDVSAYRSARFYQDEPQAFPVSRFAQPPP